LPDFTRIFRLVDNPATERSARDRATVPTLVRGPRHAAARGRSARGSRDRE
jgi:hypothetical protein